MSLVQWSLQNAKNKFSAVVETAKQGKPQVVTKRGVPAVVLFHLRILPGSGMWKKWLCHRSMNTSLICQLTKVSLSVVKFL